MAKFKVCGVDRDTGLETNLTIETKSPAYARAIGETKAMIVVEVLDGEDKPAFIRGPSLPSPWLPGPDHVALRLCAGGARVVGAIGLLATAALGVYIAFQIAERRPTVFAASITTLLVLAFSLAMFGVGAAIELAIRVHDEVWLLRQRVEERIATDG